MSDDEDTYSLQTLNPKATGALLLVRILGFFGLIASLGCMAIGLGEIFLSCIKLGLHLAEETGFVHLHSDKISSHAAVNGLLHGLEVLFFAPLPFALVKIIGGRLIEIGCNAEGPGEQEILKFKSASLLLMAAIVATNLVKQVTGDHMKWESALTSLLVLVALVGFAFVVERFFKPNAET